MSLNEQTSAGEPMLPGRESILDVVNECGCEEGEAIRLLHHSNNDAERAKHRHRMLMRYMAQSDPAKRDSGSGTEASTDPGSDDENFFDMPLTDADRLSEISTVPSELLDGEKYVNKSAEARNEAQKPLVAPLAPAPELNLSSAKVSIPKSASSQWRASCKWKASSARSVLQPVPDPDTIETDSLDEIQEESEWNFILPVLPGPPTLVPGVGEDSDAFGLQDLLRAMQHGASEQMVQNYLGRYDKGIVKKHINETVMGFPAMFFAVATSNEWIFRSWIAQGGDVNGIHQASKVPLLAFAIIHSETLQTDTTNVVATLLSLGALPQAIPAAFYTPYCRDLPENGPDDWRSQEMDEGSEKWCTTAARAKLARTMNLTHRYNLDRASKMKKSSSRQRQVASRKNAQPLLGLPYFLIGQKMAANSLMQKLLSHLVAPTKKPLVLTFAGPSGHGKTELARRLGHLLSLELEVVDCTIVTYGSDLFGARDPFVGGDRGSPLNNFLARNSGQRCIVFLDEFEKTTSAVHQTLLLPFDNGEYQDRRHATTIDCSKTIWILATNALDPTIQSFCKLNEKAMFHNEDQSEKMLLQKHLSKELKKDFLSQFGPPITGRISAFLPFIPFSPGEQAVVVHKYLLELGQEVRNHINLSPEPEERLVGNVRLRIRRDALVCSNLAEAEYDADLGARSLIAAAKSIKDLLIDAYLDIDKEISEADGMVDFVVDVNGDELVANLVNSKT